VSFDSWTVALLGKDVYNDGVLVSPRVKGLNFVGASLIEVDTINGWVTVAFAGGEGGSSPLTTKGDIYVYSSADTRLPIGTNGQILSANSATATGLQWINPPTTTDPDAIHDNVSGEISAVTLKASPTGSDLVLIEDAAASNAKKRVTLTSIVALASSTDAAAIHDNVAGEIVAVTAKTTPASADVILLEDSAAADAKKRMTLGNLLANALVDDADAIHDNVSGEIAAVTAKTTPASGDLMLIEDSAATNAKKRMTLGNLLSSSLVTDATAIHDNVSGEISAVTLKATPANNDLILIEDSAASNAKKRVTVQSVVALAGTTDPNAIHGNVSGEIAAITSKTTPASADFILIEDSAATNAKKRITVSSLLGIAPVQSVFSRTGAVVAAIGDYVASQVNNDSTVVGATVAAALNTINTALASLVPTSRTLTAGSGLTGGGTLAANRTFDVGGSASITVGIDSVAVNPAGVDHNSLANVTVGDPHTQYMNREANGTVSDNRIMRVDGTTGRDWQQGAATEDDSGNVTGWTSCTLGRTRITNKSEWYESASGTDEKLWDKRATTTDVLEERTRTDADGSGATFREVERQGTAVARVQYTTQYGLAEVADSYSVEIDTADAPTATSIYKTKAGGNVALTEGYSYEFEVSVWTHTAGGVGYEHGVYSVKANRPTGGNAALVGLPEARGEGTETGLDMQFTASGSNQQVRCQPTVAAETPHRKVRWSSRLVQRVPIVTVDT
jgi:hypothetical protein